MENQNEKSNNSQEVLPINDTQKTVIKRSFLFKIMNKIGNVCTKIPLSAWIIVSIIATVFIIRDTLLSGGICYAKRYFGIACPSCGMTRATKSLLALDFKAAFYYHPFFWDVPLFTGAGFLAAIDKNKKRSKFLLQLCIVLFIAYLICWIVRLITGTTV